MRTLRIFLPGILVAIAISVMALRFKSRTLQPKTLPRTDSSRMHLRVVPVTGQMHYIQEMNANEYLTTGTLHIIVDVYVHSAYE